MKNQDIVQKFHALRSALTSEREALQNRLQQINSALGGVVPVPFSATAATAPVPKKRGRPPGKARTAENTMPVNKPAKKNKMSAAGRASIVAAQKARWAKIKAAAPAAAKTEAAKPVHKKRKMSAEGRKAIVEAARKRWARVRAEKAMK